jgi:hypothetical protein
MKTLTCFFIALAFINAAYAGPETLSAKEESPAPTTSPTWYRDNEWNVSAWFAHAFSGTNDDRTSLADTFSADPGPGTYDRFLADDHAFGGGVEAKYFFHRYFGIGIEGFALAAQGTSYTVENFGATAAFVTSTLSEVRLAPLFCGIRSAKRGSHHTSGREGAELSAAIMKRPFTLAEVSNASTTMLNPVPWGNSAAGSRSVSLRI